MSIHKNYTVHSDTCIMGFSGEYRWLSNFYITPVKFEGITYKSSENAYQAAKVFQEDRDMLYDVTPSKAKMLWKELEPLYDAKSWDAVKFGIMEQIVFNKFRSNKDLAVKLVKTGSRYIEETNHWGDTYWGVDLHGHGENNLGYILMAVRNYLNVSQHTTASGLPSPTT